MNIGFLDARLIKPGIELQRVHDFRDNLNARFYIARRADDFMAFIQKIQQRVGIVRGEQMQQRLILTVIQAEAGDLPRDSSGVRHVQLRHDLLKLFRFFSNENRAFALLRDGINKFRQQRQQRRQFVLREAQSGHGAETVENRSEHAHDI